MADNVEYRDCTVKDCITILEKQISLLHKIYGGMVKPRDRGMKIRDGCESICKELAQRTRGGDSQAEAARAVLSARVPEMNKLVALLQLGTPLSVTLLQPHGDYGQTHSESSFQSSAGKKSLQLKLAP
eukprot:jgi/Mesen1/3964/ME000210S03209